MSLFKRIKTNKTLFFSLVAYHLFVLIILIINFPIGKWFLGWDSLNPEFNFLLNFQRSIFAAWQENYGAGLLGGHGFAATLPHTTVLSFLSFFLPTQALRPAFTFLTWYLGGLGMFFLTRMVLEKLISKIKHHFKFSNSSQIISLVSLLGSVYYLINLATVQIFSIQLEAFAVHFAALPWLFWSMINVLSKANRRSVIIFLIISFLTSVQAFIPSLFVAYTVALAIFLFVYLFFSRFRLKQIKKCLLIVFLTFVVNSYWFLPFSYYTFAKSGSFSSAYNNLISTPEMEDKSQKYGTLKNVGLLKGFYWDSYELSNYVEEPWIEHHQNTLVPFVGYLIFALSVFGVISVWIFFRDKITRALSVIFVYFFANLAISVFPFNYFSKMLKYFLPTLAQAFRTTFTKFGLGAAFGMSLFFAIGLMSFYLLIAKFFKIKKKIFQLIFLLIMFISLVFYGWPLFKGKFLFNKMLIDFPQAYLEVMDYFKGQPDGRIADFPQNCAEGWYGYNWDYFGSGFYWYGIRQPFMSRTFDVWDKNNENYFWQIEQALIREDYDQVDRILDTYDVKWLLYDFNVIHCRDKKSIFGNQDFIKYIEENPNYTILKTFSDGVAKPIQLYERKTNSHNFVKITGDLNNIGPEYTWTDLDQAGELAPYLTDGESEYDIYFPFRELFTKRGDQDLSFEISEDDENIVFSTKLNKNLSGKKIVIPAAIDINKSFLVKVKINKISNNQFSVNLFLQTPEIYLDQLLLGSNNKNYDLGTFKVGEDSPYTVFINGNKINNDNNSYFGEFSTTSVNNVSILSESGKKLFVWNEDPNDKLYLQFTKASSVSLPNYEDGELKVIFPKQFNSVYTGKIINNFDLLSPTQCNLDDKIAKENKFEVFSGAYIRMLSEDSRQCLSVPIKGISTNDAYLLKFNSRHSNGQNLRLKISSSNSSTGVNLFLSGSSFFNDKYLILPPTFKNEIEYQITFENNSSSFNESINDIGESYIWNLPYSFIKNIKVEGSSSKVNQKTIDDNSILPTFSVYHPNPAFYKITLARFSESKNYLILSQSFANEWLAFGGNRRLKHFKVDNWANAWLLNDSQVYYLIFWPQLLEYTGFTLLVIVIIYYVGKTIKSSGNRT